MRKSFWCLFFVLFIANSFNQQASSADLLGPDSLKGMPQARVVVEFDLDAISEGSFLQSRTQVADRIDRILKGAGYTTSTASTAPTIRCYLKMRSLMATPNS